MTVRLRTFGALTLGVMALVYCGCTRGPSRVNPPSINPSAAGAAAMEQYDTNKDGKVSDAELQNAPSLSAAIGNLDTNGDKAVSAEEVTQRIQAWQETRLGRTTVTVTVKYRGQPLAGADVVFEPEGFLGSEIKAAKGRTDESGMTSLSVPNSDIPGIAPGLYKVKITKEGTNLPAQYNTQTTLGAEVARDAKDAETGPVFELK